MLTLDCDTPSTIFPNDTRGECRHWLESLELWLRIIIDRQLSLHYGADYMTGVDGSGARIITSAIKFKNRAQNANSKRPIDAVDLADLVRITCNPRLWPHFRAALEEAFPCGSNNARTVLARLVPIRNALAHANPISQHEAARAICYSADVISSIRRFMASTNLDDGFPAPSILYVDDSMGNRIEKQNTYAVDLSEDRKSWLYVGDVISFEVVVDASFNYDDYNIGLSILNSNLSPMTLDKQRISLTIPIELVGVRTKFDFTLTSRNDWHRHGSYDDYISIYYKVFPNPRQSSG